jgi:uncharacterized protein YdcH (DUF465 family)
VKRNAAKSKADRAAIKNQQSAMQLDLNKSIRMAIQRGEARARAVASRAAKNLKRATMTLKNEMSTSIERAADKVFATVNGGRQKIADNYLSLKAYCVSAKFKWQAYRKKAKQPLVSIGDLSLPLVAWQTLFLVPPPVSVWGVRTLSLSLEERSSRARGP